MLVVEVADSAEGDPVITTIEGNILTDPVSQKQPTSAPEGVSFPARRETSAKPVGDRSKLRVGCNRTPRVLSYIV